MDKHAKQVQRTPDTVATKGKEMTGGSGRPVAPPAQVKTEFERCPKTEEPGYSIDDLFLFDPNFESCW